MRIWLAEQREPQKVGKVEALLLGWCDLLMPLARGCGFEVLVSELEPLNTFWLCAGVTPQHTSGIPLTLDGVQATIETLHSARNMVVSLDGLERQMINLRNAVEGMAALLPEPAVQLSPNLRLLLNQLWDEQNQRLDQKSVEELDQYTSVLEVGRIAELTDKPGMSQLVYQRRGDLRIMSAFDPKHKHQRTSFYFLIPEQREKMGMFIQHDVQTVKTGQCSKWQKRSSSGVWASRA